MRHCRELVYGSKWRIFMHDCSYWRILLGALLPMLVIMGMILLTAAVIGSGHGGASSTATVIGAAFGAVAYLALIVFGAISVHYIGIGQTILYREISRNKENQQ